MSTDSLLNPDQDNSSEREALKAKWAGKTPEEVLDAKVEADLFIKTQNARFDEMRNDYIRLREETQAKASLQDLIDRMETPKNNESQTPITNQGNAEPSFKPEDIEALLEQKLTQREASNKQAENFNLVKAKLKEHYGDNFSSHLKSRMDTLGLTQEFADDLARKHPTVFLKTFLDEPQRQDFSTPPRTQQRTTFAPNTPKRDWNYYQELKKADPYAWLNPKIAIQMHDDAIALGSAFGMPQD